MCLNYLQKSIRTKKEGGYNIGWKIFDDDHGHPTSLHMCTKRYPIAQWIHEKDYRAMDDEYITIPRGNSYKTGFHIYVEKPVDSHKARKVYFKKIVARGVQSMKNVIVAKEMFIPYLRNVK